jgi:hypothetical protein
MFGWPQPGPTAIVFVSLYTRLGVLQELMNFPSKPTTLQVATHCCAQYLLSLLQKPGCAWPTGLAASVRQPHPLHCQVG